jgi:hypothetical protein
MPSRQNIKRVYFSLSCSSTLPFDRGQGQDWRRTTWQKEFMGSDQIKTWVVTQSISVPHTATQTIHSIVIQFSLLYHSIIHRPTCGGAGWLVSQLQKWIRIPYTLQLQIMTLRRCMKWIFKLKFIPYLPYVNRYIIAIPELYLWQIAALICIASYTYIAKFSDFHFFWSLRAFFIQLYANYIEDTYGWGWKMKPIFQVCSADTIKLINAHM